MKNYFYHYELEHSTVIPFEKVNLIETQRSGEKIIVHVSGGKHLTYVIEQEPHKQSGDFHEWLNQKQDVLETTANRLLSGYQSSPSLSLDPLQS